eukprot:SAG11_NODE_779_length_7207_cov_3.043894_5_plen_89_part_00
MIYGRYPGTCTYIFIILFSVLPVLNLVCSHLAFAHLVLPVLGHRFFRISSQENRSQTNLPVLVCCTHTRYGRTWYPDSRRIPGPATSS